MAMRILLTIVTLLLIFSLAKAEIYQWVDEKGVITFKDSPPPISTKGSTVKIYKESDLPKANPLRSPPSESQNNKSTALSSPKSTPTTKRRFTGTVDIYITDWCPYCKQAQSYMKSKGISYVAYDIEKDSAANKRHKELGGKGVPLIIMGSNKMSGFSADSMEKYLNNSK
jgi:glutaredoxin-like YruB-family protein